MSNYFENEISLINNPIIKEIAEEGIKLLPEYFYKVPASSTGKYHPNYALGDGGLYRHVRAAVGIAVDLFRVFDFSPDDQDLIIVSLMLHDGWKQGENGSGNTIHSHPFVASKTLRENISVNDLKKSDFLEVICENIETHMGKWNTSKWDKAVLPVPSTEMQKFVHLCDYLASRKDLEFNFDAR